jgi:hypothetical protein
MRIDLVKRLSLSSLSSVEGTIVRVHNKYLRASKALEQRMLFTIPL